MQIALETMENKEETSFFPARDARVTERRHSLKRPFRFLHITTTVLIVCWLAFLTLSPTQQSPKCLQTWFVSWRGTRMWVQHNLNPFCDTDLFASRHGRDGKWRARQSWKATLWFATPTRTPPPWTPTSPTPTVCGPAGWWSVSFISPSLPPARGQWRGRWPTSPPGCPASPLRWRQAQLLTMCSSGMGSNVTASLAEQAASKSSTWTGTLCDKIMPWDQWFKNWQKKTF